MLRLTLANLRARPVRFLTTMLAIVVGTGFLAGTLVLGDSLGPALRSNAISALKGVDAAVEPSFRDMDGAGLDAGAIPAATLDEVRGTDGVQDAAGILGANLNVLDSSGAVVLKNAFGSVAVPVPALDPFRVVEGHAPTVAGEITIDQETSKRKGWPVGTELRLATTSGGQTTRVVGITRYGDEAASSASGDIVVSQADGFTFLAAGAEAYDAIYVTGTEGTSQDDLAVALSTQVGDRFTVQTGDELRSDEAGSAASLADTIGTGLQAFAWIALFVGIFIIYNTFSIVVAQRLRETALLRAIGASARQIRRAVLLEAVIVGFLASLIGVAVGIGLFFALRELVPEFKALTGTAGVSLRVRPTSVIEVLLVGMVVTVISAFVPAFRASRTKPMAALRMAAIDRSGTNRVRAVLGLIAMVLGAVLLLVGMAIGQALVIAAGPVLMFLGVLLGGPMLANGFSAAIGSVLLGRLGIPSRLAVANTRRNPARTATTANALLIGIFLVVFVTAAGGAVRDWAVERVSELSGADLTVLSVSAGIDPDLQQQIVNTDGVQASTAIYEGVGVTGTDGTTVAAVDFASAIPVLALETTSGSLAEMGPDDIAVVEGGLGPRNTAPPIGSTVPVEFKNGQTKMFTVAAVIQVSLDARGDLIPEDTARAAVPDLLPNTIALTVDGASVRSVQQSLDDLTASYSSIIVTAGNVIATFIKVFFNAIISSVNALLGLAVVIAVFGIVNTLILSVVERTPEIGLLRAVGMSRAQLRRSIRSESVIVAADGTLIGMGFGLFVAWAVTQPIFQDGQSFSWPARELAVIALLGFVIGLLASLIPAWRASRLDILDAIRTD